MAIDRTNATSNEPRLRWSFARSHPVVTFLLITFAWSWVIWLATIPLRGQNALLVMAIVFIGGYGPAVGGILTLGLRNGLALDLSGKRLAIMATASAAIFALMAARYLVGPIPGYDPLPENLALTAPIVVAAVLAALVGGWVLSSARSRNPDVRARMSSILPTRLPLGWTLLAVCSFAGLVLISWGAATLLGLEVEFPGLWGRPALEVMGLFLLAFTLTALARGGNEEPGWRGVLQPELQQKFSPLVAALIVSLFWSLWHLPLYLNGFYAEDLVAGMLGGGIYRVLLSIFMAWFYNRSGGNVFLLIVLHTSFNMVVNYLPTNDPILVVLWLIVAVAVVVGDRMYRKLPASAQS